MRDARSPNHSRRVAATHSGQPARRWRTIASIPGSDNPPPMKDSSSALPGWWPRPALGSARTFSRGPASPSVITRSPFLRSLERRLSLSEREATDRVAVAKALRYLLRQNSNEGVQGQGGFPGCGLPSGTFHGDSRHGARNFLPLGNLLHVTLGSCFTPSNVETRQRGGISNGVQTRATVEPCPDHAALLLGMGSGRGRQGGWRPAERHLRLRARPKNPDTREGGGARRHHGFAGGGRRLGSQLRPVAGRGSPSPRLS